MRRFICAVLVLLPAAGCGLLEPGRRPGATAPGRPTSGIKPVRPNAASEDWTLGPGPRTNPTRNPNPTKPTFDPKGGITLPNPNDGYDLAAERRTVLGGVVEDAAGVPASRVMVEYVAADGSDGPGAVLDTLTDDRGKFLIRGLKANQTYILTARATSQGQPLAARIYARTGANNAQQLRLLLVEGLDLPQVELPAAPKPSAPFSMPGPARDVPPRSPGNRPFDTFIPPSLTPSTSQPPDPAAPGSGVSTNNRDLPPPRRNEEIRDIDLAPAMPILPPSTNPNFPSPNPRPELRTDAPKPYFPPVTNIPGSLDGTINRKPSTQRQSEFLLKDLEGVPREFGTGSSREVILIEWMTTTCQPCKAAVPMLNELQTRYADRGLEVIGIIEDNAGLTARLERGKLYAKNLNLKYRLFTEPGDTVGVLRERFEVEGFPTLTLIDPRGQVLWQGSPGERRDLEALLRSVLSR